MFPRKVLLFAEASGSSHKAYMGPGPLSGSCGGCALGGRTCVVGFAPFLNLTGEVRVILELEGQVSRHF